MEASRSDRRRVTLGLGRWSIVYPSGMHLALTGRLCAEVVAGELSPYVVGESGRAVLLDGRAAIRDCQGRLVWDGHPIDREECHA